MKNFEKIKQYKELLDEMKIGYPAHLTITKLYEECEKLQRENQSLKDQLNNAKNASFNSFMKDNRFR